MTIILCIRCERCRRISVISYTYYRKICRDVDKMRKRDIFTMSEYYAQMCIGAEMAFRYRAMNQEEEEEEEDK